MSETPAETIRRAAALMRERAEAATEGPWAHMCLGSEGCLVLRASGTVRERGHGRVARFGQKDWQADHADAEFVAGMHPLVALAVARGTPVPGSAGRAGSRSPVREPAHQSSSSLPACDLADTRAPFPGIGGADPAAGDRMPASPGRGRDISPAGASLKAHGSPPAGSTNPLAAKMTEDRGRDSLDACVRRITTDLGLLRYHTHDSRRSPRGYPDLTICGIGGVLFRELKAQRGRVTPEQQAWLDALTAAGADADAWRPEDLLSGRIARELAAIAGMGTRSA